MKIPTRVKIGGRTIQIRVHNERTSDQRCHGFVDYIDGKIVLSNVYPSESIRETLLHELIHVCNELYLGEDNKLKEMQVSVVAEALFDVLTRNPSVAKYIIEG